jgi:hypothetical protein
MRAANRIWGTLKGAIAFALAISTVVSTTEAGEPIRFDTNPAARYGYQAEVPTEFGDIRFLIGVYGWLAGVKGTVATGTEDVEIDVPVQDLASLTNSAFQFYGEVHWGKWFGGFDGTWADLGVEDEGTLLDIDISLKQRIFDIRGGRQVFSRNLDDTAGDPRDKWQRWAIVDAFVGGRYFLTEPTIGLTGKISGDQRYETFKDERWDLFFGARGGYDFARRWTVVGRGDIGGFGIGNSSRFTWQLELTAGFRALRRLAIVAGYRLLSFDTIEGSGDDRSGADLLQHGPLIGAGFRF